MGDAQLLELVLAVQLAASGVMLGTIWIVQRLVYPTFATIPEHAWREHHDTHSSRITPIVLPAMAIELAAATWLAIARPPGLPTGLIVANVALAAVTWALTAHISARRHMPLGSSYDPVMCARLVSTNRARTLVWSIRVPVCVALMVAGS